MTRSQAMPVVKSAALVVAVVLTPVLNALSARRAPVDRTAAADYFA